MTLPSGSSEHLDVPFFNRTMSFATSEHQKLERKGTSIASADFSKSRTKRSQELGNYVFHQKNERLFSPTFKKIKWIRWALDLMDVNG